MEHVFSRAVSSGEIPLTGGVSLFDYWLDVATGRFSEEPHGTLERYGYCGSGGIVRGRMLATYMVADMAFVQYGGFRLPIDHRLSVEYRRVGPWSRLVLGSPGCRTIDLQHWACAEWFWRTVDLGADENTAYYGDMVYQAAQNVTPGSGSEFAVLRKETPLGFRPATGDRHKLCPVLRVVAGEPPSSQLGPCHICFAFAGEPTARLPRPCP
jgi:hypothetical protein